MKHNYTNSVNLKRNKTKNSNIQNQWNYAEQGMDIRTWMVTTGFKFTRPPKNVLLSLQKWFPQINYLFLCDGFLIFRFSQDFYKKKLFVG